MSMIISQDYMENYVINPLNKRLAEIEAKIDKLLTYKDVCVDDTCKVNKTITVKKVK
jgi:hypothetical protein